jgi:hypothetical protein
MGARGQHYSEYTSDVPGPFYIETAVSFNTGSRSPAQQSLSPQRWFNKRLDARLSHNGIHHTRVYHIGPDYPDKNWVSRESIPQIFDNVEVFRQIRPVCQKPPTRVPYFKTCRRRAFHQGRALSTSSRTGTAINLWTDQTRDN